MELFGLRNVDQSRAQSLLETAVCLRLMSKAFCMGGGRILCGVGDDAGRAEDGAAGGAWPSSPISFRLAENMGARQWLCAGQVL